MAKYPDATQRPLGSQGQSRQHKHHKIILHTMVGSLWGTDSYFRSGNGAGYSGTESHFGMGGDGEVLQWQDTDYTADAQLEGNDDCISIETADHGPEFSSWSGSDVPAWTDAQVDSLVKLVAWLCKTHDIPCVLITNTNDSTKGIGYHRQGVDPYRTHGELYSNSYGKVCPGDRRVAQIPEIIKRANQILNGGEDVSAKEVWAARDKWPTWIKNRWPGLAKDYPNGYRADSRLTYVYGRTRQAVEMLGNLADDVRGLAGQLKDVKTLAGKDPWYIKNPKTEATYGWLVRRIYETVQNLVRISKGNSEQLAILAGMVEAQNELIRQIGTDGVEIDMEAIKAAAYEGSKELAESLDFNIAFQADLPPEDA